MEFWPEEVNLIDLETGKNCILEYRGLCRIFILQYGVLKSRDSDNRMECLKQEKRLKRPYLGHWGYRSQTSISS
jgi:hypothetical protein